MIVVKFIAVSIAAVAVVVVAVLMLGGPHRSDLNTTGTARSAVECPQCASLSERIAKLELEVSLLKSGLRGADESSARSALRSPESEPSSTQPPQSQDIGAQRAAEQERYRDYIDGIAKSFDAERSDPRWSTAITSRLDDAMRADDYWQRIARTIECRAKTCRVELRGDTSSNLSSRFADFMFAFADALPTVTAVPTSDSGDRKTMTLYLSSERPMPVQK